MLFNHRGFSLIGGAISAFVILTTLGAFITLINENYRHSLRVRTMSRMLAIESVILAELRNSKTFNQLLSSSSGSKASDLMKLNNSPVGLTIKDPDDVSITLAKVSPSGQANSKVYIDIFGKTCAAIDANVLLGNVMLGIGFLRYYLNTPLEMLVSHTRIPLLAQLTTLC
jgi:hypothetical protein